MATALALPSPERRAEALIGMVPHLAAHDAEAMLVKAGRTIPTVEPDVRRREVLTGYATVLALRGSRTRP